MSTSPASIEFQLYSPDCDVLIAGSAANVQGSAPATYSITYGPNIPEKRSRTLDKEMPYEEVFASILDHVKQLLQSREGAQIGVVAHRIVHGGMATEPVVIHHGGKEEQSTLDKMEDVRNLAPLHNHHAILIVKTCLNSLPKAGSVLCLCFDTLFHISTIPSFRTTYAISQPEHETPVPLRRYGFHSLSYANILAQMNEKLDKAPPDVNLVVAHLGSGGSVCLLQGGKSVNTSMGLTPLEGIPGGTRSGSIDASLVFHHTPDCSAMVQWSGRIISKAEYVLNKESGLQALTGTNDFGIITSRAFDESFDCTVDEREVAKNAYLLYLDRLLPYIASYVSTVCSSPAPLNHLDGLVFSGGIGEHASRLRADVLNALKWVEEFSGTGGGVAAGLNDASGKGEAVRRITQDGSRVVGWVVKTDEELQSVKMAINTERKQYLHPPHAREGRLRHRDPTRPSRYRQSCDPPRGMRCLRSGNRLLAPRPL